MTFRLGMTIAAFISVLLGLYLLVYSGYVLWEYQVVFIREAGERDAHGMSRLVGYTFMLVLGVLSLGLGTITWVCREIVDTKAQGLLTFGLFNTTGLGFVAMLVSQITYWETKWGQLYAATFLLLTLVFGYLRFIKRAGSS